MSNAVTLTFWQLVAVAVAPAILTLAAGVGGPWLLESRKQEAEKKKQRAEKFEELISALYEMTHWLKTMRNIRVFGEIITSVPSPMAKVQAICAVYFPELQEGIRELDRAADGYEIWMLEAAKKRLAKDPTFPEGELDNYKPYFQKFLALMNELRKYAKREFQ